MDVRHELQELAIMVRKRFVEVIDKTSDDELKKDGSLSFLISYMCDHCGFNQVRIGALVGATQPTVGRWRNGKYEPHQMHRLHVIRKLRDAVADDLKQLQDSQE